MIFRRRLVRLHQLGDAPSIEGVRVRGVRDHYRLLNAKILEAPDRTVDVGDVLVPKSRVILVQQL
jgi:hypothetical protein